MHTTTLPHPTRRFPAVQILGLMVLALLLSGGLQAADPAALPLSTASASDCLRQNAPKTDAATQAVALELCREGWTYTMPAPKSAQAKWGSSDARTTWWFGYWFNTKTSKYSEQDPQKSASGTYAGDDVAHKDFYRRGGAPKDPTALEWLVSRDGGPAQPSDK